MKGPQKKNDQVRKNHSVKYALNKLTDFVSKDQYVRTTHVLQE